MKSDVEQSKGGYFIKIAKQYVRNLDDMKYQ